MNIYRPNQIPELLDHPEVLKADGPVTGFELRCIRLWPSKPDGPSKFGCPIHRSLTAMSGYRAQLDAFAPRYTHPGNHPMIRLCTNHDFNEICSIINDGAQAYAGIIPADRWSQPYMPPDKLHHEIDDGVIFWGYERSGSLAGVMGIQEVHPQGSPAVTLIRHAYVRTSNQGQGIGAKLLAHLRILATGPVLIGTWADAVWAIRFYQKHGFQIVNPADKNRLLKTYWNVPDRQIETSVVLADQRWRDHNQKT